MDTAFVGNLVAFATMLASEHFQKALVDPTHPHNEWANECLTWLSQEMVPKLQGFIGDAIEKFEISNFKFSLSDMMPHFTKLLGGE